MMLDVWGGQISSASTQKDGEEHDPAARKGHLQVLTVPTLVLLMSTAFAWLLPG